MKRSSKLKAKGTQLLNSSDERPQLTNKTEAGLVQGHESRGNYIVESMDDTTGSLVQVRVDPLKLTGTTSPTAAALLIEQTVNTASRSTPRGIQRTLDEACQSLEGLSPQTPLEGLLCTQMLGVHNLAMEVHASIHSDGTIYRNYDGANKPSRSPRPDVCRTDGRAPKTSRQGGATESYSRTCPRP